MMSIQLITRNLRLAPWSRGFCSAPAWEKSKIAVKTQNDEPSRPKSSKSTEIFKMLKTINDPELSQKSETTPPPSNTPTQTPPSMEPSASQSKSKIDFATRISNAKTVAELLQLSERNLNQQNAMSILTKLSVWTASNRANVNDFENDYRFLKLCRLLSKVQNDTKSIMRQEQQKSTELEMVLSIAGDDEASKIVEKLSLPQKVRVFSSLARKKTRSITVLKTLATTISGHTNQLNLKECSDLLFAMVNLNFVDEILLSRISMDINNVLDANKNKTAVVGSIVTSIGFLKYKEPILLDNLTKWITDKQDLCRPKDLTSLILTLALVNYQPKYLDNLKSNVIPKISQDDLSASEWLDYVWALCVLELQQPSHLASVLRPEFSNRISTEQGTNDLLPAQKMKVLNINAVAKHLTTNYDGPFLTSESSINNCPLEHRQSKKILFQGLLDTLKNLFTDSSYVRVKHDTKLGFVIDAECVLNNSRAPQPIQSQDKDAFRVAMMVLDYHDMCKGLTNDPNGFSALAVKLLRTTGYSVLIIPHTEFKTSDKVLTRVQYLDSKLKNIVRHTNKDA